MNQSRLVLPILALFLPSSHRCFAQFTADNSDRGAAPGAAAVRHAEAVNAGDAASRNADVSRYVTSLTPGVPMSFSLPSQTGTTLYVGDFAFSITVPSGVTQMEIKMQASFDVDLFVNFDSQPFLESGAPNGVHADYRSVTNFNSETIVIPSPRAGTYYIAIGNLFRTAPAVTGTVAVTLTGAVVSLVATPNPVNFNVQTGGSAPSQNVNLTLNGASVTVQNVTTSTTTGQNWLLSTPGQSSVIVGVNVSGLAAGAYSGTVTVAASGGTISFTVNLTVTQTPGLVSTLPDNALIMSQVVGGGNWSTTIYVTNLSNTSEGFTIRIYGDGGLPILMPVTSLGMVNSISGTLAAGESRRYETTATGPLLQAWAVLTPNIAGVERLSGFAILRQQNPAATASEAIVDFRGPREGKYVVLYDTTASFETGVALANPDPNSPLAIQVDIRNEQGALLGTDTVTLSPLGHTAFAVSQRFPATSNRRGTLRFSATSRGLVGLGLRFSPFGTFTSFPLLTSRDIQ